MTDGAGPTKRSVLDDLNFGARIAEEEKEGLADYFVETDQWRRVISGEVDVIFGPKGSGKSAIYTSLMNREDELFNRDVILVSAEKPRGSTVFQGLTSDPPVEEIEFVGLWKLYTLSLLGSVIADYDLRDEAAKTVINALIDEGLLEKGDAPLSTRFRLVWDWIKSLPGRVNTEGEVMVDPGTQSLSAIKFKISLLEPSTGERVRGVRSLDYLLGRANAALESSGLTVWILFDRLDVAFSESSELEANGLRALFKAYLDMRELGSIGLKVFLRNDIWDEITAGGFREASHITRQLRIEWNNASLLNLIVRRALRVRELTSYYDVDPEEVLASAEAQREFFDRMVPEKVDVGRNPLTFEWILARVQDGTRRSAPREVIHLLNEARDTQLQMIERGDTEPPNEELLSRAALREALTPVSVTRLEQTLYAEYPTVKPWIAALKGEKTEQSAATLAVVWRVGETEATERALRLVDIGLMEQRGDRDSTTFWVPFLYRPALNLVQGTAA